MIFKSTFFLKFFKKRRYRQKRREILLYRTLRKNNSFNLLTRIQNGFRDAGPKEGFHFLNLSCSAISVNQFLACRFQAGTFIGGLLVRSIFSASESKNKRTPFPVPFIWWSTLSEHGLKVAPIRSFFYWKLVCLILFTVSFLKILKAIRATMFERLTVQKNHLHLC